jgi:hypothetical protein
MSATMPRIGITVWLRQIAPVLGVIKLLKINYLRHVPVAGFHNTTILGAVPHDSIVKFVHQTAIWLIKPNSPWPAGAPMQVCRI